MKQLLFAVLAMLVLVGCTKVAPTQDPSDDIATGAVDEQADQDEQGDEDELDDTDDDAAGEWRTITVDAERWKFTPETVTVKQGEKVKLVINNVDTKHDARFENMNVTMDGEAIILDTSTPGSYSYFCATFCGEGHKDMKGTVIVE